MSHKGTGTTCVQTTVCIYILAGQLCAHTVKLTQRLVKNQLREFVYVRSLTISNQSSTTVSWEEMLNPEKTKKYWKTLLYYVINGHFLHKHFRAKKLPLYICMQARRKALHVSNFRDALVLAIIEINYFRIVAQSSVHL